MSAIAFFNQTCPVCGRGLKIAVNSLGQQVVCHHCHGRFVARDESSCRDPSGFDFAVLERTDQLIAYTTGIGSRDASRIRPNRASNSRKVGYLNSEDRKHISHHQTVSRRRTEMSHSVRLAFRRMDHGQRVQLVRGPLEGVQGIVVARRATRRVLIQVSQGGYIEVSESWLRTVF